jgi:hypothetical protein
LGTIRSINSPSYSLTIFGRYKRCTWTDGYVAKVNSKYIVGEAKWIGSPGGNQNKQVVEVINVCKNQRGDVIRVGIIDGFPWAVRKSDGTIINDKTCVQVQECEYDIISALLLEDFLNSFL